MSIITITSDFGLKDPYLAVMKGQLFYQLPEVNIVDISSEIENHNIPQAAYTVKNAYTNFPPNTVHLVSVGVQSADMDFVIVKHQQHFFIGLDNGMFSLVFENEPILAYRLNLSAPSELASFPEKSILVSAAAHLSRGGVPEVIGEPIQALRAMISYAPVIQSDTIRASVVHIDNYGNLITNLTKEVFTKNARGRNVEISFRQTREKVTTISRNYSDVEGGETVALFNSTGHLEIAFLLGNASGMLGIRINDTISIEFI
ncbi:MAG: S-adenosylmethionine hydrolase [Salibacteraceae bacterium]|jgi:S-adenosylmethionine hydrolase